MSSSSQVVRDFFDRYERGRNTLDLDLIGSQYPDAFLYADPNGPRVVDKPSLLGAVSKGQEFYKAHGHRFTKVLSLNETRLDDRYVMVRVEFRWQFEPSAGQPIDVPIECTFILDLGDGSPRIVFQNEHQDFQQALRARGVLPARP
jgi:hypothetical protein